MALLWLAVSTFFLLLILATIKWYTERKKIGVPGPWGLPILYNASDVSKNLHRFYDWNFDCTMKYGKTWAFKMPTIPWNLILIEPVDVHHILKANFENYIKGPNFLASFEPLLGNGIFNINGSEWKQQRQTASHLFKVKELRNMVDVFTNHGHEVLSILKDHSGQLIDMQDYFNRFTLDSFAEIGFGKVLGSLKEPVEFSMAFDAATLFSDARFKKPWWRFAPWMASERGLRKAVVKLDTFAKQVIDERRQDPKLAESTDLLSRYMTMTDENGKPFSDKYLRDIIMNFIIAGRDTTAQTLTWLFYLLSQNPDKRTKVVEEVDSLLNGALPTYENVQPLKYLQAAIDETLRLYPPVPFDGKTAVNDDTLPSGTKVLAGTDISYSPWIMGRHPDFWEAPTEYRPERWFGDNGGKEVPKVGTIPFMPFNYGPRTCLGQKMAYLEIKVLACMILQKFVLDLQPGRTNVTYLPAVTISVLGGMKMIPTPRQN